MTTMWRSAPAAAVLLAAAGPVGVSSCSRALFNLEGHPVVSARTMDWEFPFNDSLLINPRGTKMDGGLGPEGASKAWTARYGSVVSSINTWLSTTESSFTGERFDYVLDGVTDGLNEAGFGAHLLYLGATEYSPTAGPGEGVTYARVVRYLLDTCASVREAVAAMEGVRVVGVEIRPAPGVPGQVLGTHLALEDATGDSAVVELTAAGLRLYHGSNYTVMTNDPPMPEQVANLRSYQPFTRLTVPPGDMASASRFVRLAYFLDFVPKSSDSAAIVAAMRSVINTAATPLGAPAGDDQKLGVYPTWWVGLTDYEKGVYYWGWSMNPNMIWVDMKKLQSAGRLEEGSPTLHLDPLERGLVGEASGSFRPVADSGLSPSSAQASEGDYLLE